MAITTDGIQMLVLENDRRINELRDKSAYLRAVGEVLLGNRKKRFDDEAGPFGVPWAELQESTAQAFRRPLGTRGRQSKATRVAIARGGRGKLGRAVGKAGRALRVSGQNVRQRQKAVRELGRELGITQRQATQTLGDRRGFENILFVTGTLAALQLEVRGEEVIIGNNPQSADYAATHQFGDASRGIPARPFLGFDDKDLADIEDVREVFLNRAYGGARN